MNYTVYVTGLTKDEQESLFRPPYIHIHQTDKMTPSDFSYRNTAYYIAYLKQPKDIENFLFTIGTIAEKPYDFSSDRQRIIVFDSSFPESLKRDIWFALECAEEVVTTRDFSGFWERFVKREAFDKKERFFYVLEKKRITRIKTLVTEFCNRYLQTNVLSVEEINQLNRQALAKSCIESNRMPEQSFSFFADDIAKQIDEKLPVCYLNQTHKQKKQQWDATSYGFTYQFSENNEEQTLTTVVMTTRSNDDVKVEKTTHTMAEAATDKQLNYIRFLLEKNGVEPFPHLEHLTKGSAGLVISRLTKGVKGKGLPPSFLRSLQYVGVTSEETEPLPWEESEHPILFSQLPKSDKKRVLEEWGLHPLKRKFQLTNAQQQAVDAELIGLEGLYEKKCVLSVNGVYIRLEPSALLGQIKEESADGNGLLSR